MDEFSPIEAEFESAAAHDRWFRARVQASRDNPRPNMPHATAMAERDMIIAEAERQQER